MEDEELTALKHLRQKLLIKACGLVEELKKKETNEKIVTINESDAEKNNSNTEEKMEQHEHKLCVISEKVSGIRFENISRKWLGDNLYQYKTFIVTRSLKLYVELSVILKGEKEFEICDLKCDYMNLDKCYALEINPWVKNIPKQKNFSLLTSVMLQYSEQSALRKTMINSLKAEKYITDEPYRNKNGGILIYVHSPKNIEQIYLKIEWTILLYEQNWNMEHYFIINALKAGHTFAKNNAKLLADFCKPNYIKEKLGDLWRRLCHAVDIYENRNENETNSNTNE